MKYILYHYCSKNLSPILSPSQRLFRTCFGKKRGRIQRGEVFPGSVFRRSRKTLHNHLIFKYLSFVKKTFWTVVILYTNIGLVGLSAFAQQKKNVFKQMQMSNPVVKQIYSKYWNALSDSMRFKKISPDSFTMYLRVFKYEKELEIWMKNTGEVRYQLFKTMYLCAVSGNLGPKKYNNDGQIPEGFYEITNFNPKDKYKYLALKISFPNAVDREMAEEPLTANIFIHGTCETTGDIVLDKEDMEQLYLLCVEMRNRKESIYIDIYPCRFSKETETLLLSYPKKNIRFWDNIKDAYWYFEQNRWLPRINSNNKGKYIYEE